MFKKVTIAALIMILLSVIATANEVVKNPITKKNTFSFAVSQFNQFKMNKSIPYKKSSASKPEIYQKMKKVGVNLLGPGIGISLGGGTALASGMIILYVMLDLTYQQMIQYLPLIFTPLFSFFAPLSAILIFGGIVLLVIGQLLFWTGLPLLITGSVLYKKHNSPRTQFFQQLNFKNKSIQSGLCIHLGYIIRKYHLY
ncbi:MAG: hypothetical protein MJB14_19420 [Spirochaetes bacterium]|nr:hypothetical protein [Spirochaetota bacterium]